MSQNDLSIANQGFASFRSDLNSALQALGSTNSGTSAPSTTYANQLFYDTTNNILKIRNEDNDAFISLFTLDQTNDNIEALTIDGTLTYNGDLVSSTAGTSNYRAGVNAGNSITSGGNFNVTIGDEAGTALTTGDSNVAIGFEALKTEDTDGKATAIGFQALKTQNAGSDSHNTAVGYASGAGNTTGTFNTFIGSESGEANTTGANNTAVGALALESNTEGTNNVAVGQASLFENVLGSKSIGVGRGTLQNQNTGSALDMNNVAVGHEAGNDITTGVNNVLIGALAGDALTDADFNVAMGFQALTNDTLGSGSTAIGHHALQTQNFTSATTSLNVAVGYQAGKASTTAIANTLVGNQAGLALTTGNNNVAMGHAALLSEVQGDLNTAIGVGALQNQVNSSDADVNNTAVGYNAGNAVTSGTKNTLIGAGSGNAITSGDGNVVIGGYNGNENSLDIRTLDNNIVLSDGDGNPRLLITSGGDITNNVGNVSSFSRQNAGFTARNGDSVSISRNNGTPLEINRIGNDGTLVDFRQADSSEGSISVSGSTVSYSGFAGRHESSGISTDTEKGTVVSTIDELDVYVEATKEGQTRADHAKVKISDSVGDKRVYGVVDNFESSGKVNVSSVGIAAVKVTGACAGGDLLESNGDGTAKVQSDDVIKSKTIGKVTIGNSDAGVKLVSCVLYCG